MKPTNLISPHTIFGDNSDSETSETAEWRPYPQPGPSIGIDESTIDFERYQLYAIAANLLPLVLTANPTDSPLPGHPILDRASKQGKLLDLEVQFLEWYNRLPSHIELPEDSSVPLAGPILDLQYVARNVLRMY
jgi:hypothetical protein